ncbi:hypothetical protein CKAN_01482800 [Cinnamomum micranthum f. kanehirae]|uniref:Uncharacterized protein n=1 Tax=Cinnamomum micranthum f. kanehirae TaxID=337451 RepID=A0A443P597_9MAGN|nr:hypothetical protein CKAN_01482800 [Cinnamomum micranthum f. kanehirae]
MWLTCISKKRNIVSKHGLNTKLLHEICSNRRDEGFIWQRTVRIDDPLVYPTVDRPLQYCTSTVLHLKCISEMASVLQSLMWKLERGDGRSELAIFVLIVFLL